MFWFCSLSWLLVTHTPTRVSAFFSKKHMPFTVDTFGVHHPLSLSRSHFNLMLLANALDVYVTLLDWACKDMVVFACFFLPYGNLNLALILIYWLVNSSTLTLQPFSLPKGCSYWSSSAWHWFICCSAPSILATGFFNYTICLSRDNLLLKQERLREN